MNEQYSIAGKVAVISGAAGVLGGSLARHFAAQGAVVAALVHREEQIPEVLEELNSAGKGGHCAYACNVLDAASLSAVAEDIVRRYSHVDILINVAGGNVVPGAEGQLNFSEGRVTQNFHSGMGKIRMKCEVDSPGTYLVRVFTSRHWRRSFAEGARITLRVGGHSFESVPLEKSGELENVRQNSYPETWSDIGTVSFSQEGTVPLELSVDETGTFSRLGFFGEDIQNESDNNIRFMRIELVRQER